MRSTLLLIAFAGLVTFLPAPTAGAQESAAGEEEGTALTSAFHDLRDMLRWESEQPEGWVEIGGRFGWDLVRRGHANSKGDSGTISDGRVIVRAATGDLDTRVEIDVEGSDSRNNLAEAFVRWTSGPELRLRGGQIRQALNSEFATPEEDLPLPGYSYTSHLTGRHAPGIEMDGEVMDGILYYSFSATFGSGFGLEGDHLRSDRYVTRAVAKPFLEAFEEDSWWQRAAGIWAGFSYAIDDDFDDPVVVSTPHESTIMRTPRLDGDGGSWLLWEVGYTEGPFRVAFARVDGTAEDVPTFGRQKDDFDDLTAWTVQASYSLTGGRAMAGSGRWWTEPAEERGAWGDWEVAARYSNSDLDRKLFDFGYVTPGLGTQEVRTGTWSVSWRPDDVMRISLALMNTIADEDLATFGGTRRDYSVLLRLELVF
jgi:hypothetical protein